MKLRENLCDSKIVSIFDKLDMNVILIEYNGKVKEKEDIMKEFKKVETNLKSNYKKGSKFCSDLETAYDKDLKVLSVSYLILVVDILLEK